jgi:predicted dithiol-disulfide oxidoreductase (DUF899 family)
MFSPEADEGCSSSSFMCDHIPDLSHLNSRETTFAVVSRSPIKKIEAFKKRMGWSFPWYSSYESDFNYDLHVSQDESILPMGYNYDDKATLEEKGMTWVMKGEQPGLSVFVKDGNDVFHTYFTYGRGLDQFVTTYSLLDIAHPGKQESGPTGITGFRYHDKY